MAILILAGTAGAKEEAPKPTVPPQGVEFLFPEGTGKQAKGAKLSREQKKAAALLQKLKEIEKGGNVNAVDKHGQTALMHAAAQDNRLAVCWLVAKGADVTKKSKKGKTAAGLAKDKQIQEFLTVISRMNEPLNEEEKEISARFLDGENERSILFSAHFPSARGQADKPCTLTELGILLRNPQVKIESDSWWTSNSDALKELTPEIMALYLKRGALDISTKDEKGESVWISQELNPEPITLACALGVSPPQSPEKKLLVAFASNNTALVEQLIKETPSLINSPFIRQCGKFKDPLPLLCFATSKNMIDLLYKLGIDDSDKVTDEEGKIHANRRELVFVELIERVPAENMDDVLSCLKGRGWQLPEESLPYIISADNATLTESEREKKALSFIKAGADINSGGETPLHLAAQYDFPAIAAMLIEKGANVHAAVSYRGVIGGDQGSTPLHFANSPEMATLLLKAGADPNAKDANGSTPLFWNFALGNPAVVSALIQAGADVNAKDADGRTPLFGAWKPAVASALIQAGADVNAKNNYGYTPLFGADEPAVVSALIQAGADVNAKNNNGYTPLFGAGEPAVVSALIQAGADVNAKNNKGETPLFEAGNPAVVSALIQAGADVNAKNNKGETPLFEAEDPEVVSALIQAGADVNAKNNAGKTVLQYAKETKREDDVIKLLQEHGAQLSKSDLVDARDDQERTQLMRTLADPKTSLDSVKQLIDDGADVNAQDKEGKTPLMYARNAEQIKLLLEKGADAKHLDKNGSSVLLLMVIERDDPESVKLLLDAGTDPAAVNKWKRTAHFLAIEYKRAQTLKIFAERGITQ